MAISHPQANEGELELIRNCKKCQGEYYTFSPLMTKCPKCAKRPSQKGKFTLRYEKWRDEVARPYLDDTQGHYCALCGSTGRLDVDHIKKRGSNAHLRMELSNVRYLCRSCHQKET